jgi:hypothetical protein
MSESELTKNPDAIGRRALTIVVIANALSLLGTIGLIAALLSVRIDPMGRPDRGNLLFGFIAIPGGEETGLAFVIVFAAQIVLAILGIVGLIMAIVALVRKRGTRSAGIALVIALAVPLVSFIAFWLVASTRFYV